MRARDRGGIGVMGVKAETKPKTDVGAKSNVVKTEGSRLGKPQARIFLSATLEAN
jgi:hypothetical protein